MTFCGKWFVGYGVFLFICGLAGFLSNPTDAKTALISGSVFGGLSIVWGILMLLRQRWAQTVAGVTTAFLAAVFIWRSSASWIATAQGELKAFAATLITLMLLGSIASLILVWRLRSSGTQEDATVSAS